ncbi:NUDIX domain-containing protein [Streptomyces rimosus]|uniref:NUDIX domain-containing protein n=1 Tax=Streptomyces rimosus TaxID=1927 RepID=UPI00067AED1D|nr:NUDIX hydrolase [Streptomyces rimosus]
MTHSDISHGQQPRTRVGALLLLTDLDGHLVLIQPRYKEGLFLVGGARHEDESPREAARRESKEEIGVEIVPGRKLLDYYSPPNPKSGAEAGVNFVYDGGQLTEDQLDSITLPLDEVLAWDRTDKSQLDHFTTGPHAVIIRAALEARQLNRHVDLEFARTARGGLTLLHQIDGHDAVPDLQVARHAKGVA